MSGTTGLDDLTSLGHDLRRSVRGRVLVRGDEGFDVARAPWDPAVEQNVLAVVDAEDAADAAAVAAVARLAGVGVATQPYGHAPSRFEGAILLRTGRMRGVRVDAELRSARVEAGATWGDVLSAAGEHGLTGLAGSTAVVSATGFTLGGGLSWFSRAYGFAADSVRAFEVVDSHGDRGRVTAASDPDLFWALRGGGGDFALVTAMEIDLHPAPSLYGGRLLWPAARAQEVLTAFRSVTAKAPDELSVWFQLLQFPPLPDVPEPLRGLSAVTADVTFLGQPEEGRALLREFDAIPGAILDTRDRIEVAHLGGVCAEPTEPTPSLFRGELLTALDDAAAAALLASSGPGTVAPLACVQVRHLGGALARPTENGGACGHIEEPYLLGMLGVLATPEAAGPIRDRQASIARALTPYTSGRKPFTFLAHGESAAAAFPGDVLARLRDVKRDRDPRGVFRSNHPVLG
ncbi:FAD-binding protein [Microtetraspora sp. NBRC 16547]|uniref:FAD-binding oxidoreductase n=1 Tax=Microtetraspora sp. NBRC 16547 TaxID=3030993 RepID=UPI002553179D|nr:FAD-binding protein [Microtetraspora sp. NBRC 16547]